MSEKDINNMWDDFVEKLQYSEPAFRDVIHECKRCFIDPKIFHSNIFLLSGHPNFYPETGLLEPTESLQELIQFLPPAYPLTFAAAFPDAIMWFQNIYNDESYDTNPYINDLRNNPSRYYDEETGKQNDRFLKIVVWAYGKENQFECRIHEEPQLTPEQIQSALESLAHRDVFYRGDDN